MRGIPLNAAQPCELIYKRRKALRGKRNFLSVVFKLINCEEVSMGARKAALSDSDDDMSEEVTDDEQSSESGWHAVRRGTSSFMEFIVI